MQDYIAPDPEKKAFTCPHCGIYSYFSAYQVLQGSQVMTGMEYIPEMTTQICASCRSNNAIDDSGRILWLGRQMLFPVSGNAPLPNPDLPQDVVADYEEARSISNRSPRGAAALLRLAIDRLTLHLGAKGSRLDDRIGDLVSRGLDEQVQMMLDTVRVIGNESVHPGQIDLNDDPQLTATLFDLVNEIAIEMITRPKRRREIFDKLPEGARDAINKRNAKVLASS